jgi:hypothetical protein
VSGSVPSARGKAGGRAGTEMVSGVGASLLFEPGLGTGGRDCVEVKPCGLLTRPESGSTSRLDRRAT